MTCRINVNRNGGKLAVATSFDNKFLASSFNLSDREDSDSGIGVMLDGHTVMHLPESSMRNTRQREVLADVGK